MAASIIESIKLRHYYNMLDKAVAKGNIISFYHIMNTRGLSINEQEVLNRLVQLLNNTQSLNPISTVRYLIRMEIPAATILNNRTLRNIFLQYYLFELGYKKELIYSSIINEPELFEQLIEDEAFKGEISEKINIQDHGLSSLERTLRFIDKEQIENVKKNLDILKKLGFQLTKTDAFNLMLRSDSNQSSLYMIGLVDKKDIASLYHYKFEQLKQWLKTNPKDRMPNIPINEFIEPDPEDKMATYWYNQTRELGEDAMSFIFSKIVSYEGKDIFSDGNLPELFEQWKQDNPYYDDPKKEFYSHLNENLGRLFTKEGIPTGLLFSDKSYNLHLLGEVLYYNHEGHANNNYYSKDYPDTVIRFFINNIDRVPKEFQFIFRKIKELGKIEDYWLRREVQAAFLRVITDGHRIYDNRIFDENGFNEKFYQVLLYDKVEHLDLIEPHWREKLSTIELNYIDKYKEIIPCYLLSDVYTKEKEEYRKKVYNEESRYLSYEEEDELFPSQSYKDLISRYFTEKGPKRTLIVHMIQSPGLRMSLLKLDTAVLLDEEKAYLKFLYDLNNPTNIDLPINDIKKYFDANGPKAEFSRHLFDLQEYDMIIESKLEYQKVLKSKEAKILDEYKKIDDIVLKKVYKDFINENKDAINEDKIDLLVSVLQRISKSNSTEMLNLKGPLAVQLLATADPLKNLDSIELIFLKNNLPTIGKIYSVFNILHPNFEGFNLNNERSMISPILKQKGNRSREMIIFSDLLRASMGSNNRSMINYLKNIREGNDLYRKLKSGEIELTEENKKVLDEFLKHLITLYNNTLKGKQNQKEFTTSSDYIKDIDELMTLLSPNGSLDYNLADRIVDMFCHFAGITTLEEAEEYIKQKISSADRRNRNTRRLTLEQGDFVKGIGNIQYLGHILQNGSVSKEYLGAYSSSDSTPLDTDLSMILTPRGSIEETLATTEAKGYGPIWFVLKGDDRFAFTRRSDADPDQSVVEKPPISKLETFYTGVVGKGHYGIRTGFASSEINAIIIETYDKRIGLEIALNGFYIPVFDKTGKLVFTPEDYDLLRDKMRGLKEYSAEEYLPSEDLIVPGIEQIAAKIPGSIEDVMKKRKAINKAISEALSPFGITIKDHYDGDLSDGTAELIDTGSTGRFTNMPGDGDFDFMLKLDRKIMENPAKLFEVKNALLKTFNTSEGVIGTGDFRLKGIKLDGLEVPVDIDITFETKTDKIAYSTDESLKDRLSSIKESHPKEYLLIISNILLAKKILKQFEVYKPNRGEVPQGGLGGVGIENWILQNGGSLKRAAETFLEAAEGKSFEEFKQSYVIWDFGENHLITRKSIYPHDNFTYNMSEEGYEKMKKVLKEYLLSVKNVQEMTFSEDILQGISK